jgi:Tlde1 domain
MTDWNFETYEPVLQDRASLSRKVLVRTVPVLAAFSFSAAVALRLAGGLAGEAAAPSQFALPALSPAQSPEQGKLAQSAATAVAHVNLASGPSKPDLGKARNPFGGLFDPDLVASAMPAMEARTDPVGPSFSPLQSEPLFVLVEPPDSAPQVAEAESDPQAAQQTASADVPADDAQVAAAQDSASGLPNPPLPPLRTADAEEVMQAPAASESAAPLPPARPAELTSVARAEIEPAPRPAPQTAPLAAPPTRAAAASTSQARAQATTFARNDPRSFFDKIFSGNSDQKGPQLAYASQESGGGLFNMSRGPSASPSPINTTGGTAVYDISAHTVYLPNGQALEAHSGLGPYFDDPGHVHMRMRGATPPATYQLTLRESLFHGVQALRLTPVDGQTYGRSGLLAHTFMLGQRGDSNGCVSFRNYRAFLEAYMRGEIRHLKVVATR